MVVKMLKELKKEIKKLLLSMLTGFKVASEFKTNLIVSILINYIVALIVGYALFYFTHKKELFLYYLVMWMLPNKIINLSSNVRNGNLDKFLVFPINYFFTKLFFRFGYNAFNFLIYISIITATALMLGIKINLLAFLFYLPLAFLFNAVFNFLIEELSFFMYETRGVYSVIYTIKQFLEGKIIPVSFIQEVLKIPFDKLPFAVSYYYLYLALIDKLTLGHLIIYLFWLTIFSILAYWGWKKGLKAYEGQFN